MNNQFITGILCCFFIMILSYGCNIEVESKYEDYGTTKDIDGNIYRLVKIGDQVWFGENLRVSRFANGDTIIEAKSQNNWLEAGNLSKGAWCYYENSAEGHEVFGKLYNGFAATDNRGICPSGFDVSTENDWVNLEKYLGLSNEEVNLIGVRGLKENIGGQLKVTGATNWKHPNRRATNQSGFSALPGGGRETGGTFYYGGYLAEFWSRTEYENDYNAWYRTVSYDSGEFGRGYALKYHGMSIRCIKTDFKELR